VNLYREEISGAVLYEDRGNHYINIAMMIGAQENALPCTPILANYLRLPVVCDIRNRWQTAAEAYNWAIDNLWKRCYPCLIAFSPNYYLNMMDYLAQHKVFTCHLPNFASLQEEDVISRILKLTPPGSPVIGVWDLRYTRYLPDPDRDYERMFIDTVSEHGHFFLVTHDASNLSVHSGLAPAQPKPRAVPRLRYEPGKHYLSFVFSEGDNLTFQMRNRPVIWEDPARGEVPIGWSIAPAMFELCPAVLDYYEQGRTENDEWIIATSGIGYCMPGRMGLRLPPQARARSFERFCRLTDEAMRALGVDLLWILDHRLTEEERRTGLDYVAQREVIEQMLKLIPSANAVICDYPDLFDERNFSPKEYLVGDVPVMHVHTRHQASGTMAEQIRSLSAVRGRPPFTLVFISGWNESPSSVAECVKELGPGFVAVGPGELASMYFEWVKSQGAKAEDARLRPVTEQL